MEQDNDDDSAIWWMVSGALLVVAGSYAIYEIAMWLYAMMGSR